MPPLRPQTNGECRRRTYLTCPFGDPDRALEGVVEVLQVYDELGRVDTIPVKGNKVDNTSSATRGKEILQPGLSG